MMTAKVMGIPNQTLENWSERSVDGFRSQAGERRTNGVGAAEGRACKGEDGATS